MSEQPLAGVRVGVTRPPHKAASFAARLRDLGAEPIIMPTIAIEPPADPAPLDEALRRVAAFDWLLFTSANAVRFTFERLTALNLTPTLPQIGVVGGATAKAVKNHGAAVALTANEQSAAGLFAALHAAHTLNGARVLVPQSAIARPELADLLRGAGADVTTPTAYRTVQPPIAATQVEALHAITFTSPSTAENFAEAAALPAGVAVFAIGPTTAAACESLGWRVRAVADPHSIDGLIGALVEWRTIDKKGA
jgi:uroporphyrinogen-III synthase